jgi:arylsulfatase A-like enzyme
MGRVCIPSCDAAPIKRPNIVIIYGDDVGYGDLGCYGAKTIPTPHIDRLANQGLRFTSGYCSSATCTASRYSLLTGVYAWRKIGNRVAAPNDPALIRPGTTTLPALLKDAGYRTGIVGKWHLGLGDPPHPNWSGDLKPGPLEVGFDESFIMPATNDRVPCVYVRGHRVEGLDPLDPLTVSMTNPDRQPSGVTHRLKLKLDWSHGHNNSIVNGVSRIGFMSGAKNARWSDENMAEVFVSEARGFIERNRAEPFFLYFATHSIHVPRLPHPRFVGKTPHGPRGDAIVEFDWCVEKIVAALNEAGVTENTLILLSSDNGPIVDDGYRDQAAERLGEHRPAGPWRGGKYSRYEGGTRVPWIVTWPARIQPGASDAIVSQVDLPATLAHLAQGAPLSVALDWDSEDQLPALLGESPTGRESVVTHPGVAARLAIRSGWWRYLEPAKGPSVVANPNAKQTTTLLAGELYNLQQDPGETQNLIQSEAERAARLRKLLVETVHQDQDRVQ